MQCFNAALAADSACLHAAERNAQVAHQPAVHPDRSSVNLLRYAMRAVQILSPDAGGEAVVAVVCIPDHFFFVVEGCDRDNRAEDFFAVCST